MPDETKKTTYDASQITVLEGLDPVRKRPGMYIGGTGLEGLHHLIWEVFDNSLDEAMAGFCDRIEVNLSKDGSVKITDNGRGIPVDKQRQTGKSALETVLTILHAGGKFGDGGYKVSGGLHGVGVSVVNALSSKLKAEVKRDGKLYAQEYERGKPLSEIKVVGSAEGTGTTITFQPDPEIFKNTRFSYKTIIDHLRQQAYLTKKVRITIADERVGVPDSFDDDMDDMLSTENDDQEKSESDTTNIEPKVGDLESDDTPNQTKSKSTKPKSYTFYFEGGIKSYVISLSKNRQPINEKPFYYEKTIDDIQTTVAVVYTNDFKEHVYAFANNIHTTDGGTHLTGFRSALTRVINDYAKKNGWIKSASETLSGDDVREGLTAIISVKLRDPQFEGQTKAKLGNAEVRSIAETVTAEGFAYYLEENPQDGRKIVEKCSLSAKARLAARAARETIIRKGALEGMTLPGKLSDCSSKDPSRSELYIVEGDSAGGCFSGDTKIALTDGRDLSFKELITEDKKGRQNYCYTIKQDGRVGIEKIINPRITKIKTSVVKVVLDSNQEIICTPDHKFMLRDGSYCEAKDLRPDISLMPLHRKLSQIKNRITIAGYEMVLNPAGHNWIFTHLLADKYNIENKVYAELAVCHKHHIDYNKLNNNPDNITRMACIDHIAHHTACAEKTLHTKEAIARCNQTKRSDWYRQKISAKMKTLAPMLSQRAKKQWSDPKYKEFMTIKFLEFYNNNTEYREKNNALLDNNQKEYWSHEVNRQKQSEKVRKFFENNPKVREIFSEMAKKQWKDAQLLEWRKDQTRKQWTPDFREKRKIAYDKTYLNSNLAFAKKVVEEHGNLSFYDQIRSNLPKRNNNLLKFETLSKRFFNGDKKNLSEAVQNYNHKIKRLEYLEAKIDVYDIEVSHTHNFALASGIFVHNSAKQARDRNFQAILPLRGKILNVERARLDRMLSSDEIKALIVAVGVGVGDQIDYKKLRYHRIIIMTDADVDGAHIRTLLLTFFYRNFPDIVDNGHIYIAQPPLYIITHGKEKIPCYNDVEKDEYLKKIGFEPNKIELEVEQSESPEVDQEDNITEDEATEESIDDVQTDKKKTPKISIQRYKGLGEMNPEQLWQTTMNPANRVLLQVTVDEMEKADEVFTMLMGDEVPPRKRFIQTHAKAVKNLDV